MTDLVAFLRARLDEDAETVRSSDSAGPCGITPQCNAWYLDHGRALAEVEAKRRIVDLHVIEVTKTDVPPFDPYSGDRVPDTFDVTCTVCGWVTSDPTSGCDTLRLLAGPDADHPDYDPSWKPT